MTDEQAKWLRALAERARGNNIGAVSAMAALGSEYDAILALLDTVDALRGKRDEAQRQLEAEFRGNAALRNQHGARPTETMFAFVERMRSERDAAMALLAKADRLFDEASDARQTFPMVSIAHWMDEYHALERVIRTRDDEHLHEWLDKVGAPK